MKLLRISIRIDLDIPDKVTVPQIKDYVRDAVRGWKGQYDMQHPMFELDRDSVRITGHSVTRRDK